MESQEGVEFDGDESENGEDKKIVKSLFVCL